MKTKSFQKSSCNCHFFFLLFLINKIRTLAWDSAGTYFLTGSDDHTTRRVGFWNEDEGGDENSMTTKYAKRDAFVEEVESADEDERIRQENIGQHEAYRRHLWESERQREWQPSREKCFKSIGGNGYGNDIKKRMK